MDPRIRIKISWIRNTESYIQSNFQAEGHIAILLPYLGQIQECKDSLLTEEAYTALLQQERQAPTSTILSADR
jgi:hypothetical protein